MPNLDLRSFIGYLREKKELIDISKEVSVEHGVSSYARASCNIDGPAFLFSKIKEFPGQKILIGLYGSKRRLNLAVGFSKRQELSTKESLLMYIKATETYKKGNLFSIPNNIIVEEIGPCKEIINKTPNLDDLPICTHSLGDKGPFITAGIQIVRDDLYDSHGIGIHRMYKIDKNHLACLAPVERRVGRPYYRASERNESIPISIVVGVGPSYMIASQAKIEHWNEKYLVTSEFLQESPHLIKSETSNIYVPFDAELVIEGHTIPNSFYDDSPFSEYCGVASMRSNAWVVEVDCITHRKDYIYHTILTGMPPQEDSNLCGISNAAYIYNETKAIGTEVKDVSINYGNGVFTSVVSIKKRNNSEVQNLLHRLLGSNYIKTAIVVDEDIDPNSAAEILFATETRVQPDRDLIITKQAHGASLDPSGPTFRSTSKLGIDATVLWDEDPEKYKHNLAKHKKVSVPGSKEVTW